MSLVIDCGCEKDVFVCRKHVNKKPEYLCCIWCGRDLPKEENYAKYCTEKCRYEASGKK